jgi:cob(I)alamin adenosyltransferase
MESKKWKIYTKTGDQGETSLIGGTRVPKFHPRIEAYGTLDELSSYIGLIRDLIDQPQLSEELLAVESCLFVAESQLATESGSDIKKSLPQIAEADVKTLEEAIDRMNEQLKPFKNFILPGGHPVSSHCHIARCICRRAERIIIQLSTTTEVSPLVLSYINRLSDYLFVLARFILHQNGISEIEWKG